MALNYINRFFIEKAEAETTKVVSPYQVIPAVNLAEQKVEKLCLIKGKEGIPLQALQELSLLKNNIQSIIQAAPELEKTATSSQTLISH